MSKFERIVNCSPSFNKIDQDPNKNYGIGAMRIWFILKGELGAVQFQIGTEWFCEAARRHLDNFPVRNIEDLRKPQGWDIGYHSLKPMYDRHEPMDCNLFPDGRCYYDGSSLRADKWIEPFLTGGTKWLWEELEREYNSLFLEKNK